MTYPAALLVALATLASFFAAPTLAANECTETCETEFITGCMPFQCGRHDTVEEAYEFCSQGDMLGKCEIGCGQTAKMLARKSAASWDTGPCAGEAGTGNTGNTDSTVCTAKVSTGGAPQQKPTTPTLCNDANQGGCVCGCGGAKTYVFWPELAGGSPAVQRCLQAYNVPSDSSTTSQPVMMMSDGYGTDGPYSGSGGDEQAAKYYGFTLIKMAASTDKGATGFRLEFPSDGIVNAANPLPCEQKDSRDISYLSGMFDFIAAHSGLDADKVFTRGFSQNSMYAIFVAACFADKVAGTWQGGSGLAKTGFSPIVPGYQAQCDISSYGTHKGDCCEQARCTDCQFWPVYPPKPPAATGKQMVDCIASYTEDRIACGSDWYMYEEMQATGNDARLLSFPSCTGSCHKDPANAWAWVTGCLGVTEQCTAECAAEFQSCFAAASGADSAKFQACESKIKGNTLLDCTPGCSPTLGMLQSSETLVVTLSEGKFGREVGLAKTTGSAPKPNCAFDRIASGDKCAAPDSQLAGIENGPSSFCGAVPDDTKQFVKPNTAATECGADCTGCFEAITCGAVPDDTKRFAGTNAADTACGNDCSGCFETIPTIDAPTDAPETTTEEPTTTATTIDGAINLSTLSSVATAVAAAVIAYAV